MLFAICEGERILGFRDIPEGDSILDFHRQTETLIPCDPSATEDTHYLNSVALKVIPRPSMPLSISGTTITGIPSGSVLTLGEQEYQVDDGEAEITGYSGTVKITCWPYLDTEVVV